MTLMINSLLMHDGMVKSLYLIFTMDCERIAAESPPGGPESWELSERAIGGFCRVLLEAGIAPTLFIMPECAERHTQLFQALASQGVELGLHLHPQSFNDHRYSQYLGEYPGKIQRDIILQSMNVFKEALKIKPVSFRPGNFSASDETFGILSELGFEQGSVSDPGRDLPAYAAIWKDACPYPHWANAEDKFVPGDLPFFEVPLTTNPDQHHPHHRTPHELRIEDGTFQDWHLPIITYALRRMESENVQFLTLCLFTHNYLEYSDNQCEHTKTLKDILRYLDTLGGKHNIFGTTLGDLRNRWLKSDQ